MTAAIFLLLTVILAAMRTILELFSVDPATGFYSGLSGLALAQNVLYLLSVVILPALATRQKPALQQSPAVRVRGFLLLASGAVCLVSGGVRLWPALLYFTSGARDARLTAVVVLLFSVATGAVFVLMGLRLLRSGTAQVPVLAAALPAVFLAASAVDRFLASPTIASISGQTLEVVCYCSGALYFLYFARTLCRVGGSTRTNEKGLRLMGMLFALFALSLCTGQTAALLFAPAAGAPGRLAVLDVLLLWVLGLLAVAMGWQKARK